MKKLIVMLALLNKCLLERLIYAFYNAHCGLVSQVVHAL
jgi:hypothetical protein